MRNWRKKMWFIPFIVVSFMSAVAALVMVLWNAILPEAVGAGTINFLQAAGLILLSRLLLGGWKRRGGMKQWAYTKNCQYAYAPVKEAGTSVNRDERPL